MNKPDELPEIEEKTKDELDDILAQIKASDLPKSLKDFIIKCIESALWFPHILQKKNISLARLKKMIFGKGYHSKKKAHEAQDNLPLTPESKPESSHEDTPEETTEAGESTPAATTESTSTSSESIESQVNNHSTTTVSSNEKKPGHGRMSHTVYKDFTQIELKIKGLSIGSPCPLEYCNGKLYEYEPKKPRVLVRIKGQNFAEVTKYIVEQLRCNLCDVLIQADIPVEIGKEKYDASFKALMAVQKYYVAVPFYRQEAFQRLLSFPLPDSTQWDLIEQVAGVCYQVFSVLVTLAANGTLIHSDDTLVRILEIIKEIKANPDMKRKGMFTTGMIAEHEGHKIALFFNGTQHAGENLEQVLKQRDTDKPPIIQMCDALSCNVPKGIKTILANCLSHGFRKFDDLVDYFPIPCVTIMKLLSRVYDNDEFTKDMSKQARLAYHQQYSKPVMELLWQYMEALFEEKQVEPNSELGKALRYMQNHWPALTRFLTVAGAPLCNNIVERALKIAIRNRKAAMFYRTCYSAHIGGMLTSLIHTCQLSDSNPHHYLTVLQKQAKQVRVSPELWLPWNYQQTLASLSTQSKTTAANYASPRAEPQIEASLAAK